MDDGLESGSRIRLSLPVFPAPWMAPWPPTAAMDPEAAREMLRMDVVVVVVVVVVPEVVGLGRRKVFAVFRDGEADVRKPARMSAVVSGFVKRFRGILSVVGFSLRCCLNFSILCKMLLFSLFKEKKMWCWLGCNTYEMLI